LDNDMFEPLPDPRPADQPWPQVNWSPDPDLELSGQWVTLRQTVVADAPELRQALSAEQVWTHIPGGPLVDDEASAAMISATIDRGWLPWTVRLAQPVRDAEVGQVVGWTSFLDISPNDARVEIGSTAYDARVWGSQVNPETKLLLLTYAFETLGMGRVQLKTDIRNHRSQQAITRLGAEFEGVLRRYQRRGDGTVRDTVMFSITAQDWPRVKAGLIGRLADQ
jgi:RimJ/RimL family protein N-acetyltransferase